MHFRILGGILIVVVALAVMASSASARYLSYTGAYRSVLLNAIDGKNETKIADDYSIGIGRRLRVGRLEFPVTLKGDEFLEYVPGVYKPDGESIPARFIYIHNYCTWNAVAFWRYREVWIKRRDLNCETWWDESRTQP